MWLMCSHDVHIYYVNITVLDKGGTSQNLTAILQVRRHYPGWKVRLYTDARWRRGVLCPLLRDHAHFYVCDVEDLPPPLGDVSAVHPTMWRTLPLGESQVAAMLVRDTDSPVSRKRADDSWCRPRGGKRRGRGN